MAQDKLSKKEISDIAVSCIFISLGIGFTTTISISFQGIFHGNLFGSTITFIFATLFWALIIFVLVIYSPLFRKFFLKWFAIRDNEEDLTKLLNQLLVEQKEIKQDLANLRKELKDKQ